jgi:protein TonB
VVKWLFQFFSKDIGMAAAAQSAGRDQPSRRRGLRYRAEAPLYVTVLREGIPDTLPGRSVNIGEGGVAVVLAGELLPGEAVGLKIQLSPTSDPLRARALVRHHDKLRAGMEFVGLSAEQRTAIRVWAEKAKVDSQLRVLATIPIEAAAGKIFEGGGSGGAPPPPRTRHWRELIFLLLSAAVLLAVLWWRWNRGWEEVESGLEQNEKAVEPQKPQAHVPADVMEKLLTHRVDPDYPEAARSANLRGVIALDVVVGRDGSVLNMRPLNGPEVLGQAAMDALRWWRFKPYMVDGQPGVVETTVAVEFKP